jgi:hypothetical protein
MSSLKLNGSVDIQVEKLRTRIRKTLVVRDDRPNVMLRTGGLRICVFLRTCVGSIWRAIRRQRIWQL